MTERYRCLSRCLSRETTADRCTSLLSEAEARFVSTPAAHMQLTACAIADKDRYVPKRSKLCKVEGLKTVTRLLMKLNT